MAQIRHYGLNSSHFIQVGYIRRSKIKVKIGLEPIGQCRQYLCNLVLNPLISQEGTSSLRLMIVLTNVLITQLRAGISLSQGGHLCSHPFAHSPEPSGTGHCLI